MMDPLVDDDIKAPTKSAYAREILQSSGEARERFYALARARRRETFGNRAYIRGVLDVSNYCRCVCSFCGNSADLKVDRYRLPPTEAIHAIERAAVAGIDFVQIAAGEDPQYKVADLVEIIGAARQMSVRVELALSNRGREQYAAMYEAGARSVAIKFETSNENVFSRVKMVHKTLSGWLRLLEEARDIGYDIVSGNIIGFDGQTIDSLVEDVALIERLAVTKAEPSCLISNRENPRAANERGDPELAMRFLVALSLTLSKRSTHICTNSSFGVDGKAEALRLGATELSLNITPTSYQGRYSIYGGKDRHKADLEACHGYAQRADMQIVPYLAMNPANA